MAQESARRGRLRQQRRRPRLEDEVKASRWYVRLEIFLAFAALTGIVITGVRLLRPDPPAPVAFDEAELDIQINPRYAFQLPYPSTWTRADPGNSDGFTFTSPEDNHIQLRAWGATPWLPSAPDEYSVITAEIERQAERTVAGGGDVLDSRESGMKVVDSESRLRSDVTGWMLMTNVEVEDGTEVTVLTQVTYDSGRLVFIEAQRSLTRFPGQFGLGDHAAVSAAV